MSPPAGPPPKRGRTGLLIGAIVAVLVILAAAVTVVIVTRDDDDDDFAGGPGEIFLEPASSEGSRPFGSLTGTAVSITTTTASTSTTQRSTTTTIAGSVPTVSGGERGLYGGSLDTQVCDPEGQIRFLQNDRSMATAFVGALNADPTLRWSGGNQVTVEQLPSYIRELTPMSLTRDTRVTNYGYNNGRATGRQSVLQAGTAVMVDRYGVPRVKCNCGNPLTPPIPVTTTPIYTGPQWPSFTPANIVVINQTTVVIEVFILTNTSGAGTIERTPGSDGRDEEVPPITAPNGQVLGTGDVQFTLTWTGDCDLDLHVIDPSGAEIYYGDPTSATGGTLDVDDIPDAGATGTHVENIYWPTGSAPRGSYLGGVVNIYGNTSGSCPFTLTASADGRRVGATSGSLADGAESTAVDFVY